jgi:hypothetical protein
VVNDDGMGVCCVEECGAFATEQAPGVFFCGRHWDAMCEAFALHRTGRSVPPATAARPAPAPEPATAPMVPVVGAQSLG